MNFAPKSEEKQQQSPSVAIFSQPNTNEAEKNKVFTPVCAIVIRLIEMKTKTKRFYRAVLLLVVLLCDVCFVVRYRYIYAVFDLHIRMKTKQIRKKRYLPLTLYGGKLNFP